VRPEVAELADFKVNGRHLLAPLSAAIASVASPSLIAPNKEKKLMS